MDAKAASKDQLGDDMLEGAAAIAKYLFGSQKHRRKVYYLAGTSKLPIFRLGAMLCVRKSVLAEFITGQEKEPIRLLQTEAQIAALSGTIRQFEQAGLDTAGVKHLLAKRRKELNGMSGR